MKVRSHWTGRADKIPMEKKHPAAASLLAILTAASLAFPVPSVSGLPATPSAVSASRSVDASKSMRLMKSTRLIGWSLAQKAPSPSATLGALVVTGPGSRPVTLQRHSGGKWKDVRSLRSAPDRRLNLAFLAQRPGDWRLVVRPWRGWAGKTTSPLRIEAQPVDTTAPMLADAKPIKDAPSKVRTRIPAPNVAPTAAFTTVVSNLALAVDAAGSSDPDGTIASYAWNWGDNTTGAGGTASHAYSTAGDYLVTLTVTDDRGATTTTTKTVTATAPTPAPNVAPTAAFTTAVSNLALAVDAAGSSDPDGTIASYAWNWGDNTTGTGRTASHTYSTAGDYLVTLTVTDDRGATTATTMTVTATASTPTPRRMWHRRRRSPPR